MSREPGAESPPLDESADPLDELDQRILAGLRDNGRISMSALADQVGVSRATVYTRVDHLLTSGVITGFSARRPAQARLRDLHPRLRHGAPADLVACSARGSPR